MSDKTLQVANTRRAFFFDSNNHPTYLNVQFIDSDSIDNSKLVDSEITINGTRVPLGGSINIHGGGGTPSNQSQLSFRVTPTSIEFDSDGTIGMAVGNVSITSGYTINSIVTSVRDSANAVIHTQNNTDGFNVTVNEFPVGTIHVVSTAQVTRTADNVTYQDERTVQVPIHYGWYASRSSTAPTSVGNMTNQGVWQGDTNFTAPTGTDRLYVALPTRTGGYHMVDGVFRLFTPADGSTFDTNWTLYSTNEANAGTVYRIEEV